MDRVLGNIWRVVARVLAAVTLTIVLAITAFAEEADFNAVLMEVDRQLEVGDYAGALEAAERGNAMLVAGDSPEAAVNLYVRHVFVYMGLDEYDKARRKLFDGIELIKDYKGEISSDYEFALRDTLLEIAKQEREYDHANRAAKEVIKARVRVFGKQSAEASAARLSAARWYLFSSQFSRAANECEKAITVLEGVYGEEAELLYKPLMLLANSHMAGNRKPERIRSALERVLTLDIADPVKGKLMKSEALARLGDTEVIFFDSAASTDYYRRAWQARNESLQGDAVATNSSFADPQRLRYVMPSVPGRSDRGAEYFGEGYVVTEFTVTADGTVADAKIVDSKPGNDFDQTSVRAVRRAKFRPRVVDGEPVDARGERLTQTYSYEN